MKLDKLQEAYDEMFDFIAGMPSGLDGFESDFDAAYKELLEAKSADVAPVVHAKRIKTKKHNWKKDIDGKIDLYAWDEGYCEGPFCLECGRSFCIHCEEVHRGKDAVEAKLNEETCYERTVCSVCGKPIPEDAQYCNCGAKIDLEE